MDAPSHCGTRASITLGAQALKRPLNQAQVPPLPPTESTVCVQWDSARVRGQRPSTPNLPQPWDPRTWEQPRRGQAQGPGSSTVILDWLLEVGEDHLGGLAGAWVKPGCLGLGEATS